jgi:hypothetical protein
VTPAFAQQVQQALDSTSLKGTVETSTYGETSGCGGYLPMSVDYTFVVEMAQLDNSQNLASAAAEVLSIAKGHLGPVSAPNLGRLAIVFQAAGQSCSWSYYSTAWTANPSNGTTGVIDCAVPPSS